MPDYSNAKQTSLSELDETERFTVTSSAEIRTQLLALSRQPDIITAYFNEGKSYLLTAVLGILNDRGLLVLDFGPDETITRNAIASGRLVCTTKHNGVPIRFSCENLQSARYKALPAIATPIPASMFRKQRREFFRVTTPKLNGPRCEIADSNGDISQTFNVCDMSAGGIGIFGPADTLHVEIGDYLENCKIILPEHGEVSVNLEVRNSSVQTQANGEKIVRYGTSFDGMSISDHTELQRYIFHLQTLVSR